MDIKSKLEVTKKALLNTEFSYQPFRHLVSENVFDDELYEKMFENFPENKYFDLCKKMTKQEYEQKAKKSAKFKRLRYPGILDITNIMEAPDDQKNFWLEIKDNLCELDFMIKFLKKCGPNYKFKHAQVTHLLNCDKVYLDKSLYHHYYIKCPCNKFQMGLELNISESDQNFKVEIHTDSRCRFLTTLFYLAPDDKLKSYGTALYDKKSGNYVLNKKVDFLPKTALTFTRCNDGYHAVHNDMTKPVNRKCMSLYVRA